MLPDQRVDRNREVDEGWLFDYYATADCMVLWFLLDDGRRLRLAEVFQPEVYLTGPDEELKTCLRAMVKAGDVKALGWREKLDFWTGRNRRVYTVRVLRCGLWRRALDRYADRYPNLSWYNADLMPEQCFGYERDVFPLMRCRVEHEEGRLVSLECQDDRWATDYLLPPLRIAELSARGVLDEKAPRLESLTLLCDDRAVTWDDPAEMLSGFQRALDQFDPDVLLTDGGDSFTMPLLFSVAERQRFPLRVDREPPPQPREIRIHGRSFHSYGRILYQAPEYALTGRWHLDRRNSFAIGHNGMEGLLEVARLSRIPVQRIARRSLGTGISSIQLDHAWRDGCLVPWKKTEPEVWKSAHQLLKTDRGGLVYAPESGFHEDVVELDFVAMYPSIMARLNVSPETVNCPCCQNGVVPEIGYTICERRRGLVSRALEPIIRKRVAYKAQRKAARAAGDELIYTRVDRRQDALKWMLVCCFGYLGYRNARFGRIEAHEAVSAYSREMLLRARDVCEARGWHMIHANVDCVWIRKPGFRDEEIGELCAEIDRVTGLTIALEGIYRWLAFLPSRQVPDRPVPTRYFGAFRDGTVKYRGIECRRRDLPDYVRDAQLTMLKELARDATNCAAYRAMGPAILERLAQLQDDLRQYRVDAQTLMIHQSLSQEPDEYAGHGLQSIAARQAVEAGLSLHAGEKLSYIITSARNADRSRRVRLEALGGGVESGYDPEAYVRLLRRAFQSLLWPADITINEDEKPLRRRRSSGDFHGQLTLDLFCDAN